MIHHNSWNTDHNATGIVLKYAATISWTHVCTYYKQSITALRLSASLSLHFAPFRFRCLSLSMWRRIFAKARFLARLFLSVVRVPLSTCRRAWFPSELWRWFLAKLRDMFLALLCRWRAPRLRWWAVTLLGWATVSCKTIKLYITQSVHGQSYSLSQLKLAVQKR